jgi:hypothetical protein
MRKIILAVAAIGAIGLALPMAAPANAEEGISIRLGDHHHHHRFHDRARVHENFGRYERWHHHDRFFHRRFERRHHDAVIIKHRDYD